MRMIFSSAANYFEFVYRCHCVSGKERIKILAWHYLYLFLTSVGVLHLLFLGWGIVKNRYEEFIYYYTTVSHNIFYKWSGKSLYFISSGTLLLFFVLVLTNFIWIQIPKLAEKHLDDVYDFVKLLSYPHQMAVFCAEQKLLFKSYIFFSSESAIKIVNLAFTLNYYSIRIIRYLRKFIVVF